MIKHFLKNNDRLRVGIVGCGLIGGKRAQVIIEDSSSLFCCAADVLIENAQAISANKAYDNWQEMLERESLDAVVVSTPNKYLKDIVISAAQRKIHVLCEKPLGRSLAESEDILLACKENGVILKTGFNHRHHPALFQAHELVTGGAIGPVYFVRCMYGHGGRPGYEKEWRASKDICGGGELLDQGVHVVDLFRWFLGDFEEAVGYTQTCYWPMEVEDNAFAIFRTSSGRTAMMHTSWTQWKNRFTFEIFGEAGYLIVEGLGGSYGVEKLTIGKRPRNGKNRDSAHFSDGRFGEKGDSPYFSAEKMGQSPFFQAQSPFSYLGGAPEEETMIFDGPDISWELEWKEFTAAIREGREPLGSGLDGLEANRMIEAVYRSAKENRPVKIREM